MLAACALVMGFGIATECLMLPARAIDATRAYKMYFSYVQCTVKNSSLGFARTEYMDLPGAVVEEGWLSSLPNRVPRMSRPHAQVTLSVRSV